MYKAIICEREFDNHFGEHLASIECESFKQIFNMAKCFMMSEPETSCLAKFYKDGQQLNYIMGSRSIHDKALEGVYLYTNVNEVVWDNCLLKNRLYHDKDDKAHKAYIRYLIAKREWEAYNDEANE